MGSEDISVIRHWNNEISNYGLRTGDPAASVMVRALEALEATTTPYYDHDHMDRALTTLRNELPDALRASGEDAFRLSVVGLVESVHRALRNVAERRRRDEPHVVRPADGYGQQGAASYGLLQRGDTSMAGDVYGGGGAMAGARYEGLRGAYAVKQEPLDEWALPENVLEEEPVMHEEEVSVKKELMEPADDYNDDYNNNSYALLTPVVVAVQPEATMPELERQEPGEDAANQDPHASDPIAGARGKLQLGGPSYPASPLKVKVEQLDEDREDSPARPSKRSKALRQSGDAAPKQKKERRSRKEAGETAAAKRRGSRSVNYREMSDGAEGEGRAAKRPKMLNIKKEELSGALACVLCDYQTAAVGAFICHLKKRHGTTPAKMGIWFRCECGHLSRSNGHSYRKKEPGCGGTSSTLIFVAGGLAMQEMQPEEEDEEWQPARAAGGADAVEGDERREWRGAELADEGEMVDVTHVAPSETALDGRVESREGSPAEASPLPPTARPKRSSAARPINYSELVGAGDDEEEVVEVPAVRVKQRRIRREDDGEPLMKCVLCKVSLITVHAYLHHLKSVHGTSATKEGIWFRCACGKMSQSSWHASAKICDDQAAAHATVVYGVEKQMDEDGEKEDAVFNDEEENQKAQDDDVIDDEEENQKAVEAEEEIVEEGGGYLEIVQLNDSSRVLNEFGLEEEKEEAEDEETKEEDASSIARRCHICKTHSPRTIGQFVDHLRKRHWTTLMKSGCWLECACGEHVTSYATIYSHSKMKDCDGRSFTVNRM